MVTVTHVTGIRPRFGGPRLAKGVQIAQCPSPNYGPRRDGLTPRLIVLHFTAMATAEEAIAWLCNPQSEVSSHYVICKTGAVTQLVAERDRAWHAGAGSWRGMDDINSRSIGIELDNDGASRFPNAQMDVLEELLEALLDRWSIPAQGVIGHSDLAPGRKDDPGPLFDWPRLAARGLAAKGTFRPPPAHLDVQSFRQRAVAEGYTAEVDDETLLTVVRLRYRPHAFGPLSRADFDFGHPALWV